jgi:hypothetical protein
MKNPFEYGGVASGEAFCNREREVGDLVRAMENAEKRFAIAGRPPGPTLVPIYKFFLVDAATGCCWVRQCSVPKPSTRSTA